MAMLEGTPKSIILRSPLLVCKLGISPDVAQKVGHHWGEEATEDLFPERAGESNGSMIFGLAARLRRFRYQGEVNVCPARGDHDLIRGP